MASYRCPRCKNYGMEEDGRAKVFACCFNDCRLTLKFEDYNKIASAVYEKQIIDMDSLPSNYCSDVTRVNNLLNFIYLDGRIREGRLEELSDRDYDII